MFVTNILRFIYKTKLYFPKAPFVNKRNREFLQTLNEFYDKTLCLITSNIWQKVHGVSILRRHAIITISI